MRFTDTSRGRPFAKDPCVVDLEGKYFLYYTLPPFEDGRLPDGYAIGIAASDDLEHWSKIGEMLPEQLYEANGICAPGGIVLRGQIHLFYQTYGNGPNDAICHAVSDDGVHFKRNPSNPIFSPKGEWNNGRAIDADVLQVKDRLFLYFTTRDPAGRIQKLGAASARTDSGFEKGHWRQEGKGPILQPELDWEQDCIEAPAVCAVGGRYFMFYGGAYNCAPQQIGCAASEDTVHWHRISSYPFLPNGLPGEWNSSESGHPYIFVDPSGRTVLFYQGSSDHGKTWTLSSVEVDWTDGLPVLAKSGE